MHCKEITFYRFKTTESCLLYNNRNFFNIFVILRNVIEEDPVLIRVLIRGLSTIHLLTNGVLTSLIEVPNQNVLRICKCFFKG